MTRRSRHTLLMSITIAVGACGRDQEPRSQDSASGPSVGLTPAAGRLPGPALPTEREAAAESAGKEARLTDAQIIAVVLALNAAEVDQGKLAVGRTKHEAVKELAQTMIARHGQAVKELNELSTRLQIAPADGDLVTRVRVHATEMLTKLDEEEAADFDEEYVEAQVEMHEKALKKLDERLLPSVRNAELKTQLEKMRARAAEHREMGRALDARLD